MDPISRGQSKQPSAWLPKDTLCCQAIKITKYCCGILALSAVGFEIEGYTQHSFSSTFYKIGYGVLALAIVGFAISYFYASRLPSTAVPIKENTIESKIFLVPIETIKDLEIETQIHELCEMDMKGEYKPCSEERVVEIVSEFQKKELGYALNTIPDYYLQHCWPVTACDKPSPLYTPLQYWAGQGNLAIVKILLQADAVDYCCPYEGFHYSLKSALYFAALHGHFPVVKYLLKNGASPSLVFDQNILYSFIPHLVFELCQNLEINKQSIECLREILSHLFLKNYKNLKIQLSVPVDVKQNCVQYASNQLNGSPQNPLEKLLEQYGGKKEDVVTNQQLQEMGYHTGTGFTLGEQSRYK